IDVDSRPAGRGLFESSLDTLVSHSGLVRSGSDHGGESSGDWMLDFGYGCAAVVVAEKSSLVAGKVDRSRNRASFLLPGRPDCGLGDWGARTALVRVPVGYRHFAGVLDYGSRGARMEKDFCGGPGAGPSLPDQTGWSDL